MCFYCFFVLGFSLFTRCRWNSMYATKDAISAPGRQRVNDQRARDLDSRRYTWRLAPLMERELENWETLASFWDAVSGCQTNPVQTLRTSRTETCKRNV
ncbi:hypothetical protein V8E55_000111, partial [Tylopilus felleus]